MRHWIRLDIDLRSKAASPKEGQLVAMRMEPLNGISHLHRHERHDIGHFASETNSKRTKLWWHSTRGVEDPIRLKKQYDMWWCPVPEFDGF